MVAALTMSVAAAAQTENPELTYKGINLGESISKFQSALPDFQCTADKWCEFDIENCVGHIGGASVTASNAYDDRWNRCKAATSFGGALVSKATAFFSNGSLTNLRLTVPVGHMDNLLASVQEKFGLPTSSTTTPFMTRAGATFPNWQKTWSVGNDYLFLSLRSGSVELGSVWIVSAAKLKAINEELALRKQQGSKDF